MFRKLCINTAICSSLVIMPVASVQASDLLGGIVGGLIGGAIINSHKPKKTYRKSTTRKSSTTSVEREKNRNVQTSLNYFGFPVGRPDGVMGRKSREAVSTYQAYMSMPINGQLAPFQQDMLISAYHRAIAGGERTTKLMAANPDGPRGVLKVYHQALAREGGVIMASTGAGQSGLMPSGQGNMPQMANSFANTGQNAPAATMAAMPNFGSSGNAVSMANHCNKVSLITNSNGGYMTLANMRDPAFALDEQFCLARIYAISKSEELANAVQGVTSAQMQAQCETIGPMFKEQIAALSLGSRADVIKKTSEMILASGMAPTQLGHTASICLGIGYRTDNTDVALASGLILTALGQSAYGELMGHHLVNGFGTTKRQDLATQWYASAVNAIETGQPAVFVPGQADRPQLIKAAALGLSTPMTPKNKAVMAPQPATFVLPSFGATNAAQ
ncbi:MAG: hypothetical protein COB84_06695 [Rhodobacteraceae bacterium]|nr:MAG: hypothetical protein COB84_06695 [Paracoccaceae bacterium]